MIGYIECICARNWVRTLLRNLGVAYTTPEYCSGYDCTTCVMNGRNHGSK